ncbi:hypothetical protein [Pseudomonas sp. H3(2019)]|uniref:hypothetical protein n=1 Tax=Pseudomonas sp. H3(2019) TaxID=2598724 RepID=UPI0011947D02|nr:hypothetical protein [Pseudomonas sp. H3(2019)]TVT81765.1 hypothetical protein FPT12_18745 [Pseudomonas sp. H3(2019)]
MRGLIVRISFELKLPALNHAALKTISKCSLAKANSAFSLVFALPDLRSASFTFETWPVKPAEGRAVYLNEADKQPPARPSVIRRKVPVLLT